MIVEFFRDKARMYRRMGLVDEALFMARWAEELLGEYPITRYTRPTWPETYRQSDK